MQPDRPSKQTLGGGKRDLSHRLLRFHLPIGLASALVLVAFMTLPPFDPQAYPQESMGTNVLPEPIPDQANVEGHGEAQNQDGEHGENQDQDREGGHGGAQTRTHGRQQDQTGDDEAGPSRGEQHEGSRSGSGDENGNENAPGDMSRGRQQRLSLSRLTTATGYLATALLSVTLLIGPANLLLRRRNPVSSYLRRDVGAWTALFSVVHVIFGLRLHSGGRISAMLDYFVEDGALPTNSFGLGNWTGLAATVIVVGLLVLSNDLVLRKLKAKRWKRLQRFNYALFAMVVAHAFFYGALLRTTSPYTLLLILAVIVVLIGQATGIFLWQRRHSNNTSTPAVDGGRSTVWRWR